MPRHNSRAKPAGGHLLCKPTSVRGKIILQPLSALASNSPDAIKVSFVKKNYPLDNHKGLLGQRYLWGLFYWLICKMEQNYVVPQKF